MEKVPFTIVITAHTVRRGARSRAHARTLSTRDRAGGPRRPGAPAGIATLRICAVAATPARHCASALALFLTTAAGDRTC